MTATPLAAGGARKRPLTPDGADARAGHSGAEARSEQRHAPGFDEDDSLRDERHGSVNRESAAASPRRDDSRWSWPPGDDARSDSESESLPRAIPCCGAWRACAASGACAVSARPLRRIHDEDGATVDVVHTRQFGDAAHAPDGGSLVVYKTYDTHDNDALTFLVQTELELYGRMQGRSHIIHLLDTFTDARGNPVLVFPFVSDDFTPQAPSDVQSYMRQLLEALAFLHDDLHVMHRNIKRANILFSGETGALTLIDFEGACPVTEGAFYTRFGNNLYRAPEVAAAKMALGTPAGALAYNAFDDVLSPAAQYGPAADVFSAGVCFFELLMGCRRMLDPDALSEGYAELAAALAAVPPDGDPRGAFGAAAARGGAAARVRLSWEAADVLRRMLATEPSERVRASDALAHPYFARDLRSEDERFWGALAEEAAEAAAVEAARRKRRRRGSGGGSRREARSGR